MPVALSKPDAKKTPIAGADDIFSENVMILQIFSLSL
jgi:hypothetical protein